MRPADRECLTEAESLAELLAESIDTRSDCILLSGGVDTSFVAHVARRLAGLDLRAITAFFEGGGRDVTFSGLVASSLGIPRHVREYGLDEALEATREVVALLGTFDPIEVRNDVTIYVALKAAREHGCECVLTGDGGDELFAGYEYMLRMPPKELREHIRELSKRMRFSSLELGSALGVRVQAPLLSERVVDRALKVPTRCLVSERGGRRYGKYLLRLYLERHLSPLVAWRDKAPIEEGSGSVRLSEVWSSMVSADELAKLEERYGVKLGSRDRAYLFKVFKEELGLSIRRSSDPRRACPWCGSETDFGYCRVCGYYPRG